MLTETEAIYLRDLRHVLDRYEKAETKHEKRFYLANAKSIIEALRAYTLATMGITDGGP